VSWCLYLLFSLWALYVSNVFFFPTTFVSSFFFFRYVTFFLSPRYGAFSFYFSSFLLKCDTICLFFYVFVSTFRSSTPSMSSRPTCSSVPPSSLFHLVEKVKPNSPALTLSLPRAAFGWVPLGHFRLFSEPTPRAPLSVSVTEGPLFTTFVFFFSSLSFRNACSSLPFFPPLLPATFPWKSKWRTFALLLILFLHFFLYSHNFFGALPLPPDSVSLDPFSTRRF